MIKELILSSYLIMIYHVLSTKYQLQKIIGPNGQKCPESTTCPIRYNSLTSNGGPTSLTSTIIQCEEQFKCCTCSSITCGTVDGDYCESFTAYGDSSAFYVYPISITGDPQFGTVIDCNGYKSCEGTQIKATSVSAVQCTLDSSCANAEWSIHCLELNGCGMECDGKESCKGSFTILNAGGLYCSHYSCSNGEFILRSNDADIENIVDCDGTQSCYQSEITANNVQHIECHGAYSCAGAVITVIDPKGDFELQCDGYRACRGLTFMIKITSSSEVTQLGGFDCSAKESCKDVNIVIINENVNTVTIEDLECSGRRACTNATFTLYEQPGVVIFEECFCGRKDTCVDAKQTGHGTPIGCIPLSSQYTVSTISPVSPVSLASPVSPASPASPVSLQLNNIDKLICGDKVSCGFANIRITDPLKGLEIKCDGRSSCEGMNLEIIVPETSSVREFSSIECISHKACSNASISIVNKSPHKLLIDELLCSSIGGCEGASFNLIGPIAFGTCTCGDNGAGCMGAIGIDSCFENLDKLECRERACYGQNISITNPSNGFELICSDVASCNALTVTMVINDAANDFPVRKIKGVKCGGYRSCAGLTLNVVNQQNGVRVRVNKIKCKGNDSCLGAVFNGNAQGNVVFKEIQCNGNCGVSGSINQCVSESNSGKNIFCGDI